MAGNDARTPVFLNERVSHVAPQRFCQGLTKVLGPFHPSRVGRDHNHVPVAQQRRKVTDKQLFCLEVFDGNAPCILDCRQIVHVQQDRAIYTNSFKHRCNVPCRHRIARLALAVLPRIAEIRNHCGHARCRSIAQSAQKKQRPAQLVIDALSAVAIKRLNDKHILVANVHERPRLVLAILKVALFMLREANSHSCAHL